MPLDSTTPWGKAFAKMIRSDEIMLLTLSYRYVNQTNIDKRLCRMFKEMYGYNITITQPQVHDNSMTVPKVRIDFESKADITMFVLRYHLQ